VTAPIVGPRTAGQLDGALGALEITLDAAALGRLDEIFPGPGGAAPRPMRGEAAGRLAEPRSAPWLLGVGAIAAAQQAAQRFQPRRQRGAAALGHPGVEPAFRAEVTAPRRAVSRSLRKVR
jgi:hypothetical protein